MIRLGLTGSIGMGKSTIAAMFKAEGVPVWDADDAVHRLYAHSDTAKARLSEAFGDVITGDHVDRVKLLEALKPLPNGFERLNGIVHPLLADDRLAFMAQNREALLVVLDIPLLFEGSGRANLDKVLVVSAPADVQRARVLARPNMTPAKFDMILSRQMPDADKRARADFVIDTGQSLDASRAGVKAMIRQLIAP